jgi:hypothetical protein
MHLAHPGLVNVMRTLRNQAFDWAGKSQARTGRIPESQKEYTMLHIYMVIRCWESFRSKARDHWNGERASPCAYCFTHYSTLLEILDSLLDGDALYL